MIAARVQSTFQAGTANESAKIEAKVAVDALVSQIEHFWAVRNRPDPLSTTFTTPTGNYQLLTANGLACSANCPQLRLSVYRPNGAGLQVQDQLTFRSMCLTAGNPSGTIGNYNPGLANTCLPSCGAGLVPTVQVTSAIDPIRFFPGTLFSANANQGIPGLRGLAACFSQTGTSPLSVRLTSFALQSPEDFVTLMVNTRQVSLPFGNFGQVQLTR